MTTMEMETLLRKELYGVYTLTYPPHFVAVPKIRVWVDEKRVQWHRDILPALRRYLHQYQKQYTTKKSAMTLCGIVQEAALIALTDHVKERNKRIWIVWKWEDHPTKNGKYRGVFKEVEFDVDKA